MLPGIMIFTGCGNEVEISAPYKDIPVVYCILNPGDSVHYLRLEKSFNGEANAYEMAQQADSIYYPDAEVYLERWSDNKMQEQFNMIPVTIAPRINGVFAEDPNRLYATSSELIPNNEYRLNIRIPSTGAEISARTHLVNDFRIIKPEYYRKSLPFSSYGNNTIVEWVTARYTRAFHLQIRFHYLEINGEDTVRNTAYWNIANFVADNDGGGIKMETNISHRAFYKWLGSKLSPVSEPVFRLAARKSLDFWFTVGGDELYTYIQIYRPDDNIPKEHLVFTNISNGIGIFSSRFEKGITGKALSEHSIDSIAHGIYTRHLGFDDSLNDYYHTGI